MKPFANLSPMQRQALISELPFFAEAPTATEPVVSSLSNPEPKIAAAPIEKRGPGRPRKK